MSYYKFEQNDIFTNRIKAHPRSYFLIHDNQIFYNDIIPKDTHVTSNESILDIPQGHISLYELNVNRIDGDGDSNLIHPFITKQGTLGSFKTVSTESFQAFDYGQEISGSYPLTSTISTDYYSKSAPQAVFQDRSRIQALRNTFNYYKPLSKHYAYETTEWNKDDQDIKLVSIPSIFFGSSIKKGSVKMNYYIEGEKVATLEDKNRNGELIQTFGQFGTAASSSTQATGATAAIQFTNSPNFNPNTPWNADGAKIILTDAEQTTRTFVLQDTDGSGFPKASPEDAYPPNGELNEAGEVVVQLPPKTTDQQTGLESIATSVADAINSDFSDIKITAEISDPVSQLTIYLTQDIPGSAGETQIQYINTTRLSPSGQPFDAEWETGSSYYDGELISHDVFSGSEVSSPPPQPTESEHNGKIAGVVLYNEGFVALTGSWDLSNTLVGEFVSGQDNESPKWKHWGGKDRVGPVTPFQTSSSWDIEFLGTNYIPTMTMFAHAKQADLNYSNNPTFIDYGDRNDGDPYKVVVEDISDDPGVVHVQGKIDPSTATSAVKFVEDKDLHIANIAQSPYEGAEATFEKTTYISKIGIYDENKNLIAVAKLATPVKKTESRQYTFKMKLDF